MAKMLAHQWQQRNCNKGNNTIAMTAKAPLHKWWWQCHCNKGNNASLRMATKPSRGWQQCRHRSSAMTPLLQGQQCHLDNGKYACALTLEITPLLWGQHFQSQQQQRRLCINGHNAIATRAMTPARQQVTRATMLAWQQRRCLCINDGNNAIVTRAIIAIATAAKMPAHCRRQRQLDNEWQGQWHWWWQQCHSDKGNNIIWRMAAMQETPAHWQQQHHHNKGNNTSSITSGKGDNASLTIAEMPVQWWRQWHQLQLHLRQPQRRMRINGNNAIRMRAMTLARQQAIRATTDACPHMQTNISHVCVGMHPCKHIICLSWQASLQPMQTFAVGKRATNKPLALPPPHVLQHWCAEIGVNCSCQDKKVPTTFMLVLHWRVVGPHMYLISWLDWLFKQNRFVPTFPTGKGRSGQRHFYQFQSKAEQWCMPLNASGWRWPHLEKGKEPHWQFWSGHKP